MIHLLNVVFPLQDKVYQFCSKTCCEDYKKLHCIVTFCEYCQEEKTLHETVKFSGVKRPFCSEGTPLLFRALDKSVISLKDLKQWTLFLTHLIMRFFFRIAHLGSVLFFSSCVHFQAVSCCINRILLRSWVWSVWAATTATSCAREVWPSSLVAWLGTSAVRLVPRSSTTGTSRSAHTQRHQINVPFVCEGVGPYCIVLIVATRRRGVTAVRCRVTWRSLWCGGRRWSNSATRTVCWSSTASRTSPSWSHRKAQKTPP